MRGGPAGRERRFASMHCARPPGIAGRDRTLPTLLLAEIDAGVRAGQVGLQDLRRRVAAVVAVWPPTSSKQGRVS